MLGLLGILEAGRSIAAPVSIGGEWKLQPSSAAGCAAPVSLNINISQSGSDALIMLGEKRTIEATLEGNTLSGKDLRAAVGGQAAVRTLEGTMSLDGCGTVAFRAVRQARKRGE